MGTTRVRARSRWARLGLGGTAKVSTMTGSRLDG